MVRKSRRKFFFGGKHKISVNLINYYVFYLFKLILFVYLCYIRIKKFKNM